MDQTTVNIFQRFSKRLSPIAFVFALGCIEPYEPKIKQDVVNILVVEGFMNATDETASVKLSQTLTISDPGEPTPESHANVSIQSSLGDSYLLTEQDSGLYVAKDILIDKSAFYTLHITTQDGIAYASDTIRAKGTPAIDSLNFGVSSDERNLTVQVSTHDPTNTSRYYAWDYVETYQYHAAFYSGYVYRDGKLLHRLPEEDIYTCWRSVPSTNITIATSSGLGEDVINHHSIAYVPKESPKISIRYSILVKQRAISAAEYDYLTVLRKTTESLGGIFGTTPATIIGNIHRVDDESFPVLGYFSGGEVTQKRFFIERNQLPENFRVPTDRGGCTLEQTCDLLPSPSQGPQQCVPLEVIIYNSIIISDVSLPGALGPSAYYYTTQECGDCRKHGGVTKRPEFW